MVSEFVGIGVLVILFILFAWLTRRAWRARNGAVKWIGTILGGLLSLVALVGIGLAARGSYLFHQKYDRPVANITVERTPERLARGEKLAHVCVGCHATNGQLPLSGQNFGEGGPPIGTFYAANLTPAGELKDWTDGEIIRAIREGIHKDGRSLIIMPAGAFHTMSDDDVQSLVAFLRSQPATEPATPPTQINFVGALFMNLLSEARSVQPPVTGPVSAPPAGPTAEYGQYLVSSVGGCRDCHGANLAGNPPGGNAPAGPNLTTLGQRWSEEDFIKAMRTGQKPDGKQLSEEMPWKEINAVASDDDLRAIYAHLKSLQALPDSAR
jgi:cytochrome c553